MSQMKTKILIPAAIALMGVSAGAWADDPGEDGEVTISLMPSPNDDLPEVVTNRIPLPDLAELVGNENAQEKVMKQAKDALNHAEEKRTQGREHGWSHANMAREQAQDMAENAKAKNEDRGRSEDRPDRPEPPGPPETPPGRD
jgi:hypothetical protein